LIRVLIADDHDIVRKGVRNVLRARADVEVSGEAADGKEAIDLALNLKPDVIILDLSMPVLGGFAAAIELRRLLPETPIIFYSMHDGLIWWNRRGRLGCVVSSTKAESATR